MKHYIIVVQWTDRTLTEDTTLMLGMISKYILSHKMRNSAILIFQKLDRRIGICYPMLYLKLTI